MESICPICKKPYDGVLCTQCTVTDLDVSGMMASEGLHVETQEKEDDGATAFLVDLVSNRKIPITTPRCKVGRDDLNDIVISGDQSISRFHFVITKENNQYLVQDGKSRHGTFLNGNQITAPEPIHDGDVLKVGVSLFWFVIENVVPGAETLKLSPVEVEADSAQIEFGAPEPAQAAVAPPAAPRKRQPRATETGAFPALDLSDPLHIELTTPGAIAAGASRKTPESTSSDSPAPAAAAAQEADSVGEPASSEVSTKSAASPAGASGKSESSAAGESGTIAPPNAAESSVSNSKQSARSARRSAKPINIMDDESGEEEFGNLSFFEPLTEVVNELGSESLLRPAEAATEPSTSNGHNNFGNIFAQEEPSNSVSEASNEPAKEVKNTDSSGSDNEKPAPVAASQGEEKVDVAPERAMAEQKTELASTATLEKLAEAVEEAGSPTAPRPKKENPVLAQLVTEAYEKFASKARDHVNGSGDEEDLDNDESNTNGAKSRMSTTNESESESNSVPDWCKGYLHGELTRLAKELHDLNEEVRSAQQKIKEVEGRTSLTKGLRNTLLTANGEELVEGCRRVLSLLGWTVKIGDEDKNELLIETDTKQICIARVVWTETQADRSHLGQLSISQTRYWCEQGVEPKGILIVSNSGENGPHALTKSDMTSELADYASKKEVCLMTTLQLLSIFKDIALHDGGTDAAQATIIANSGWMPGYNLEPSDFKENDADDSANKINSLMSA